MSKELHFPGRPEGSDSELGRLLRPLYEAPAEGAYWDDLQTRIMQRVRTATPDDMGAWWGVLERWARVGVAAAVVVAVISGALLLQHQAREARLAYEAVLNQPPTYSLRASSPRDGAPPSDAILRYGLP